MHTAIQTALLGHLKVMAGLPPLQEENSYIAPSGTWARATFLPARTQTATVGEDGYDRLAGLLQIDIFVPVGTGVASAGALADAVREHFPRTLGLDADGAFVQILRTSRDAGRTVLNDKFYQIPVTVEWLCIA